MKAIKWSLFVIAVLASNYSAFAGETTSHKDDKNVVEALWASDNHTSVDCGDIYETPKYQTSTNYCRGTMYRKLKRLQNNDDYIIKSQSLEPTI